MRLLRRRNRRTAGFSLVELTIVIVILGVLSTYGVPRFLRSVERSKATEAFNYLSTVRLAQETYLARNGRYAEDLDDLDAVMRKPQYFAVGAFISTNWERRWRCELTRQGASSSYGDYTVVFDEEGFSPSRSTIPPELIPNP